MPEAIEDGVVEIDAQLRDRIATLKSARELVQASLQRFAEQAATSRVLTPERTAAIQARKAYLQAVNSEICVVDDKIQIIGDKASLAAVIAGRVVRQRFSTIDVKHLRDFALPIGGSM